MSPLVVGRKNWLFAGGPRGAKAACVFFTLIETAKASGLEPYAYLRYIFEQIPKIQDPADYVTLLPQRLNKQTPASASA